MKRYLNLNDFGGKMVIAIAILGIGIPGAFYGVSLAIGAMGIRWAEVRFWIWGSLAAAGALLVILLILIIIEQIQDHLLYRLYLRSRGKRVPSGQGLYECPYCGNRNIKEFEYACPVCGKELSPLLNARNN